MRPTRQITLALPLLALLAACGGGGDAGSLKEAGYRALDSGDAEAALPKFEAALGKLSAEDEDFIEVSVARCQALAYTDAERSRDDFLALDWDTEPWLR